MAFEDELVALIRQHRGSLTSREVRLVFRRVAILADAAERSCLQCGDTFEYGPGTGRTKRARYCSDKCRVYANRAAKQDIDSSKCRTMSVPEAARYLNVSRNAAYTAAKNGEIPSIRVGKLVRVPVDAMRQMLGEI